MGIGGTVVASLFLTDVDPRDAQMTLALARRGEVAGHEHHFVVTAYHKTQAKSPPVSAILNFHM